MKTIPSPHGGLLHHQHHQHDGAPGEHDSHPGHRHFRRHVHGGGFAREERHGQGRGFERREGFARYGRHGRGHGFERRDGFARDERHGRGHGFGRGRNPLAAMPSDRDGVHEVVHVAQEIRSALRTLARRGTREQLAEGQRLLEDTRRALYLILATEPEAVAGEQTSPSTDDAPETVTPPEIG